jgi:translation initiation factor IF-3
VKVVVKEIRFGPQTDDHDFNFKLKHGKTFLEEGSKVKAYVFFKGRSILFKEQGEVLLLRFAAELEDYGKVESMPTLEGKKMIIMLSPKKVPAKAAAVKKAEPAKLPKEEVKSQPSTDDQSEEAKPEELKKYRPVTAGVI